MARCRSSGHGADRRSSRWPWQRDCVASRGSGTRSGTGTRWRSSMSPPRDRRTDVAIVGGGPAGAAVAIGLARRGIEATVFERTVEPKWRASGVYSSPITRQRLGELGVDFYGLETMVARVPGLAIQLAAPDATPDGVALGAPRTVTRLTYERWGGSCGIDRVAIDRELLSLARGAGATVCAGATVRSIELRAASDL